MMTSRRKIHVVPTHVRTPEIVFAIGGVSFSARQFLVLLVGAALSYDLWKHLTFLNSLPAGMILAGTLAVLPGVGAMALAFGQLAGRPLDAWGLVIARYLVRPRRLIWRSVRHEEKRAEEQEKQHA